MREPTNEEREKETSVLWPVLADFGTTALLLVFGILTRSLTLLSEGIRSVLMLCASLYGLLVMRAMHRDKLTRYEYGVGKIEQFVPFVIGLGLVVSGLWVARSAVDKVFFPGEIAGPLGLAMAAVINAINTAINCLGWFAMTFASSEGDTEVFRAQVRARFIMMVSSLFLQVTLTVAALARDADIALLLDAAGAFFVAGLMIFNGIAMMSRSLPDLLDAGALPDMRALIRRTAQESFPEEEINWIRTRRSRGTAFVEVAVANMSNVSVPEMQDRSLTIQNALRDAGVEIDIAVVPTIGLTSAVDRKSKSGNDADLSSDTGSTHRDGSGANTTESGN